MTRLKAFIPRGDVVSDEKQRALILFLKYPEKRAVKTRQAMKNRAPRNDLPSLKHMMLVTGGDIIEQGGISYEKEMAAASDKTDMEWLDRDDPLIRISKHSNAFLNEVLCKVGVN